MAQSLGFLVDGEQLCITPIPERWTKVLQAFGWLASRPRVSGKAVERLLGHAVHFAMLRRELLSIFRSLYDFVARSYNRRQRLWASAAKEAKWAQHLFKLCSVDIKRSWSSHMSASDASLSGVAVCSRELSVSEVARHGRVRETWRYVTGNPVKPREIALQHGDPFSDPSTVKPLTQQRSDPYELNFDFPEIEKEIMQQDSWSNDFAIHMQHPEHITLLEGRGVVAAMRHKLRSSSQFGFKHLHLTDNMSVVLLCSKGMSSTFGMLRVCRRLACLLLATDSFLQVRWVPSELNVADKASRQWEHLRQHVVGARPGPKAQEFGTSTSWNSAACASRQPQAKQDQESWKEVEPHQRGKTAGEEPDKATTQRSCQIQGTNIPGEDGSVTACSGRLSQANAGLLSVPENPQDQQDMLEEQHDEVRRGLQLLHESHVRSRLRACRRNKIPRSRVRHVPRLWAQAHISPHETFTAGLAEVGTSKDKATNSLGLDCCRGDANADSRTLSSSSSSSVAVLHCIPEPRRDAGIAPDRSGEAHAHTEALVAVASSCRKARKVKGGPGRREHPARLPFDSLAGRSSQQTAISRHLPDQPDILRAGANLAQISERSRASSGSCSVVSAKTFRTITRQVLQTQAFGRSQTTWKVDSRHHSPQIRESCQTEPRIQRTAQDSATDGPDSSQRFQLKGAKIFRPAPDCEKRFPSPMFVIEIFSGCSRLSQACAAAGFHALAIDIDFGPACDVLDPAVLQGILRFLRKHRKQIVLVWLGTPCTTWSRARKADGGPPPLRDDDSSLFGFAHLPPRDLAKVTEGNKLLQVSQDIIALCNELQLRWVLENPWTSRIWLTPFLKSLAQQHSFIRVDFCAFHMPWRKATGLLFGHFLPLQTLACECQPEHGRCCFTNRRHIVLVGKDSAGQWLTRRAQPYPWLLCHQIAKLLAEHI